MYILDSLKRLMDIASDHGVIFNIPICTREELGEPIKVKPPKFDISIEKRFLIGEETNNEYN